MVKKGQLLVELDSADAKIALAQAQAELGEVQRKVQGYFANDAALGGQVLSRDADIARANAQLASAQADFERARVDLQRRQALARLGRRVGGRAHAGAERLRERAGGARSRAGRARAGRWRRRAPRRVSAPSTTRSSRAASPDDQSGGCRRARQGCAGRSLTCTHAHHARRSMASSSSTAVQVGQQVQPGQTLMTIVPIEAVYVNANYKEAQLRKVRLGQPAVLTSDLYGRIVKYHGKVAGIGGGTGAAFALIPAQNATGNWIKVVQRLPVRIALDPAELRAHPLRVGLSMNADIDVARR